MPIIGTQQSPIQIMHEQTFHAHFPFSYFEIDRYEVEGDVEGVFEDHNFDFNTPPKELTFNREPWYLHKMHLHAPAEHLINSYAPNHFELHLVHYQSDKPHPTGPKVVISAMFEIAKENLKEIKNRHSFHHLNKFHKDMTKKKTKKCYPPLEEPTHLINPNDFLPDCTSRWYHYQGSLTSGTYSEDCDWFVLDDKFQVCDSHVQFLCETKQKARPIHALDRRFILRNFE